MAGPTSKRDDFGNYQFGDRMGISERAIERSSARVSCIFQIHMVCLKAKASDRQKVLAVIEHRNDKPGVRTDPNNVGIPVWRDFDCIFSKFGLTRTVANSSAGIIDSSRIFLVNSISGREAV